VVSRRKAIGALVVPLVVALVVSPAGAASAAPCRTGGAYDKWLAELEREATAQGVSQATIAAAAPYLTYDQRIVNIDRGQRVFTQTFLEFSDRMAAAYRIQRGAALIKSHAPVFARIDRQFGVPAPVIVAFWALESDFGVNMGITARSAPSPRWLMTAAAQIASARNSSMRFASSSAATCARRIWSARGLANSVRRR
jgi:membrane-bound lytic murein transglycosylase B